MDQVVLYFKSHIKGYTRKDGVVVKDHERNVLPLTHSNSLFLMKKPKAFHPKADDDGKPVGLYSPSWPSSHASWDNGDAIATFTPGGGCPDVLNGIPLSPWIDHPEGDQWDYVDGQMDDLVEPVLHVTMGKQAASGVIIHESDGRVWIVSPTNRFGGYRNTFPKGKAEEELSLQANAIKEAFEESGLKVAITGLVGDFERGTSVTRYYSAVRIGGSPVDMGWESQSVHLVPKHKLASVLDNKNDTAVLVALGGS